MEARKYIRFTALSLLLGILLAACVVEDGEQRPRRTQGEYAVLSNVDMLHAGAVWNLRVAAGFDAYLRQSTDEGRAKVVKRFFPWVKFIVRTDSGWKLQPDEQGSWYYQFVIEDDLLLGQAGASWLCYRADAGVQMQLICDLKTEGDRIRYKGVAFDNSSTDWLVGLALTEDDFVVTFTGRSEFVYKSDRHDEDRWTVVCRADSPVRWGERENGVTTGVLSVIASLSGAVPRTIGFTADYNQSGVMITTRDGVSEFWSRMD